MNAQVENPYPRLFDDFFGASGSGGYCIFSGSSTLERGFNFMPSGCSTATKSYTFNGLLDLDVWSHLAIVERLTADGQAVAEIYVNGEEAVYAGQSAYPLETIGASRSFYLGNSKTFSGNRYFCGDLDDFRLYNYALSREEVRRVYRGLAEIDAGEDFTVAGMHGVLQGTVAANAGDDYRRGYAGTTVWSLVSAPSGGEGARILQPAAAVTSVTLPMAGMYVFRLTISDLGVTRSDDVAVTCVASGDVNAAPTVSVSASPAAVVLPETATLTAVVSDDGRPLPAKTRVRWSKKSGLGGVWFEPDTAAVTRAGFGAAGTYVLTATADVTVAGRADGVNLDTALLHYFTLDGTYSPDPGSAGRIDRYTAPDYVNLKYVPGKVGNGLRASAYSGAGAYFTTGYQTGEVAIDDPDNAYAGSPPPKNDYLTISAWVYIDPNDEHLAAGRICGASVVGQGYTFGLRYNEKFAPTSAVNTDGFTLFQQGRNGSTASGNITKSMVHFPPPNPSPKGRWTHLCAILARSVSDRTKWEMWYDGVKQTASANDNGNTRGRVNGNTLMIGGMPYTSTTKTTGDFNANWQIGDTDEYYSRTFPGVVDEVRIWTRRLMPEEIRYLAANPMPGENRGPSIDTPVADRPRPVSRRTTPVRSAVFADVLPEGKSLTYEWSVLSDNASLATLGDRTARGTTFTASRVGTYVVQLKVSDGERTVCSRPLTVEVLEPGLGILFR